MSIKDNWIYYLIVSNFILGILTFYSQKDEISLNTLIGLIIMLAFLTYLYIWKHKKMLMPMMIVYFTYYLLANIDGILPNGIDNGNDLLGTVIQITLYSGLIFAALYAFYIKFKEEKKI